MMLTQEVFDQAVLLASPLDEKQEKLLMLLCEGEVCALRARLREGLVEEDCQQELVAAASLLGVGGLAGGGAVRNHGGVPGRGSDGEKPGGRCRLPVPAGAGPADSCPVFAGLLRLSGGVGCGKQQSRRWSASARS